MAPDQAAHDFGLAAGAVKNPAVAGLQLADFLDQLGAQHHQIVQRCIDLVDFTAQIRQRYLFTGHGILVNWYVQAPASACDTPGQSAQPPQSRTGRAA